MNIQQIERLRAAAKEHAEVADLLATLAEGFNGELQFVGTQRDQSYLKSAMLAAAFVQYDGNVVEVKQVKQFTLLALEPPQSSELFDTFWKAYPHKVGKDAARKAFAKRRPGKQLLAEMLDALEVQKQSEQWRKNGGQFIPHPSTWLTQGRWQDGEPHDQAAQAMFV